MLDERTGCALQTRDERMILGKTKNGVILSEVEGSRHALSLRRSVTTAAIACVLSLVCLSACTDYVEQMKDDFDDWEAERALESSSSAALVAASASSDSALASRRGIKELFSSLDELDVRVYAYQYDFSGLDFLHLYVENNEEENFDSLTLRLYLEALPEEMEKCATLVDVDICQKYDSAGFNIPCESDLDIRNLMRKSFPMRLDYLKKSGESRYTYYIPLPLGPLVLESHSRVRLDIGFSSGISNDGYKSCETLRTTAKKRMSATSGDWSWSPHVAAEDGADYAGMPLEDRDYGDFVDNVIPVNPYVVVTRNEQYISGISPSFADKKIVSSSSSSSKVTELVEVTVGSMTDSRDGQTYKTVKIGEQVWMAENLNFETDSSFCYNNEENNCTKYGRYYTWAAAVGKLESECGYGKTCSLPSGNIQGVCPSGWHLPSKAEWETLFNAVGGSLTAGKVLKSTSGWVESGNGTDSLGFSALPAYGRDDGGHFGIEGSHAYFWSSAEYYSDSAYSMILYCYDDAAYQDYLNKNYAFSVRCLQD